MGFFVLAILLAHERQAGRSPNQKHQILYIQAKHSQLFRLCHKSPQDAPPTNETVGAPYGSDRPFGHASSPLLAYAEENAQEAD